MLLFNKNIIFILIIILFLLILYLLYNNFSGINESNTLNITNIPIKEKFGNNYKVISNVKSIKISKDISSIVYPTIPTPTLTPTPTATPTATSTATPTATPTFSNTIINAITSAETISLIGVFVYSSDGSLIDLNDPANGFISGSGTDQNPYQTYDNGSSVASNALKIYNDNVNKNRTLDNATSINNDFVNNFNNLIFDPVLNANLLSSTYTGIIEKKSHYWVYNFKTPVSISGIEIFTRYDSYINGPSNMIIELYDTPILKANVNNDYSSNLLATANYGIINSMNVNTYNPYTIDKSHKVFTFDDYTINKTTMLKKIEIADVDNYKIFNMFFLTPKSVDKIDTILDSDSDSGTIQGTNIYRFEDNKLITTYPLGSVYASGQYETTFGYASNIWGKFPENKKWLAILNNNTSNNLANPTQTAILPKTTYKYFNEYRYSNSKRFVLVSYSLTSAYDTTRDDTRKSATPKTWDLLGSNNGINYVIIDSQINDNELSTDNDKLVTYNILNQSQGYNIYRLAIISTNNNSINIVHLGHIKLTGYQVNNDNKILSTFPTTSTISKPYSYINCYNDNATDRAIPTLSEKKIYSVEDCYYIAKQQNVNTFGIQRDSNDSNSNSNNLCFTGNTPNYTKYGLQTDLSKCGEGSGYLTNKVYTIPTKAPTTTQAPTTTKAPTTTQAQQLTQTPIISRNIALYTNNISLQDTVISKINDVISKISNLTKLNTEAFTVPVNDSIIKNSIKLTANNDTNSEINSYINSYNNSIALLDDPNQMSKAAFDTYIHLQDQKINNLNTNLAKIKNKIKTQVTPPVKGFRSMNNSKILNVEEYPNPTATNTTTNTDQRSSYTGNGSSKYPNYLIYGNNGCLQYEAAAETNNNTPSWGFKSCDANNTKQQFTKTQINTINQYNAPITNPNNESYILNDSTNTQFGFYTVNPNNAFDQCLQLNNDGLSVMPCTLNALQRFKPLFHSVLE